MVCPRPSPPHARRSAFHRRADGNVAAVSHGQHVLIPPLQPPEAPTRRWSKRPGDLNLWPFDLESGVRVTCDVVYHCANFGLHRPLCSRLKPDVRDRQTDRQTDVRRRQTKYRLMPRLLGAGYNNCPRWRRSTAARTLRSLCHDVCVCVCVCECVWVCVLPDKTKPLIGMTWNLGQ